MATPCVEERNRRVIAIGIDDSEHAEKAFDWCMDNVKADDDEVVLIHCPETYDFSLASPDIVQKLLKELESNVKRLEDKYRLKVQERGITGRFRTGGGKAGEVIIRLAKEEEAAMIITGTRGLGKFRRTVLGSVSDFVLHHSPVPVIVCRGHMT